MYKCMPSLRHHVSSKSTTFPLIARQSASRGEDILGDLAVFMHSGPVENVKMSCWFTCVAQFLQVAVTLALLFQPHLHSKVHRHYALNNENVSRENAGKHVSYGPQARTSLRSNPRIIRNVASVGDFHFRNKR